MAYKSGLFQGLTVSAIALAAVGIKLNKAPLLVTDLEELGVENVPIFSPLCKHDLAWYFRNYIALVISTPLTISTYPSPNDRSSVIVLARGFALMKMNLEHSIGRLQKDINADLKQAATAGLMPKEILAHFNDDETLLTYRNVRSVCAQDTILQICVDVVERTLTPAIAESLLKEEAEKKKREGIQKQLSGGKPIKPGKRNRGRGKAKIQEDSATQAKKEDDSKKVEAYRLKYIQDKREETRTRIQSLDRYAEGLAILNHLPLMKYTLITSIEARKRGNRVVHAALHEERPFSPTGAIDGLNQARKYYPELPEEELRALMRYTEMNRQQDLGKYSWTKLRSPDIAKVYESLGGDVIDSFSRTYKALSSTAFSTVSNFTAPNKKKLAAGVVPETTVIEEEIGNLGPSAVNSSDKD